MLTASAWEVWAQHRNLSDEARQIVAAIRSAPPSRLVRSGAGNVPCRYPSTKMGHTIQAESHTVELAFVHALEQDRTVLEYWDQPGKIRLVYRAASGRRVVAGHTPDYFELRIDAAGWVECKPEERLNHLAHEAPNRYRRDATGQWTCPPGEEYAAQYGLTYRVFSSADINWIEQRNWAFLADYFRADCPTVDKTVLAMVRAIVEIDPGVTVARLQQRVATSATADDINIVIATAQIYVDLRTYALAEPEYAPVFRDEAMAQAYAIVTKTPASRTIDAPRLVDVEPGMPVVWDGCPWTIGNPTDTHTPLISPKGAPVELLTDIFEGYVREGRIVGVPVQQTEGVSDEGQILLSRASVEELATANRRYAVIRPHLAGGIPLSACDPGISLRTKFAWAKKWREAEAVYGNGYLGLLSLTREQPYQRRLVTDDHIAILHTILDEHYATYRNKKLRRAYGPFLAACTAKGLYDVSQRTFYIEAGRYLTEYEERVAREGTRAAYPSKSPYHGTDVTLPRHGDRPWDLAHIDHTEVDLELLASRSGRALGKAWMTVLIDASTRRVLAVYLTYARPSYISCMMAVRLCVQRWGRLPRAMVVDGGPEFHSTYFETLLAWYKVTCKTRPPAEPKYGSLCERLFGTANTTFIHTLLGNTQVMKNVRQVTPAVNPKTHACWTLADLYTWLCEWAYEVYDTIDHPALGQSPRDAYAWTESRTGARVHTRIPYDRDFIMRTLPTTRKGTALVQPGHGVKINTILYWCSAFDDPEIEHTAVPVRYDPFDAGVAYAYLTKERRWVECRSDYYALLHDRSERELMLIAAEIRKAQRDHTAGYSVTAKQLAAFSTRADEHEQIMLQRDRDTETRTVLTSIQGGWSAPSTGEVPSLRGEAAETTVRDGEDQVEQATEAKLLPRLR